MQYFDDKDKLVKYCKEHGIMLFVDNLRPLETRKIAVASEKERDGQTWFEYAKAGYEYPPTEPVIDGLKEVPSGIVVSPDLHGALLHDIQNDCDDIRRLSSWPIERTFVYVDISNFSSYVPAQQAIVINDLIQLTKRLLAVWA